MVGGDLGLQVKGCQPAQLGIELNVGEEVQVDVVLAVQEGIEPAGLLVGGLGDGIDGHCRLFL